MPEALKIITIFLKIIFFLLFLALASVLIFGLSYFLGHQLLGGIMMGSDTSFALSVITYLNRWFPKIPLWFPYHGAGQSITLGYFTLTYYPAIIIHRLTSLGLVQAMRLVSFLTIPVISLELFLYGYLRLKNPIIGLMAGLLFPLSSASWAWQTHAGLYAMTISVVFILPAFLFYDWFLELILTKEKSIFRKRLALLLAVVFLGLAIASHLAAGAATIFGMTFFTLFRCQLFPLKVKRLTSPIISLSVLIVVIILALGISAFIFLPSRHYSNQIFQDMIPVYGQDIPQFNFLEFLGVFRPRINVGALYLPMFLNIVVTVFAGVGLVFALIKRHFLFGLGLSTFILAFITSITRWINNLSFFFAVLMLPTNIRLASFVIVTIPILAAYGFWSLGELPFWLTSLVLKLVGLKKNWLINGFLFLGGAALSILLFFYSLNYFKTYQRWSPEIDRPEGYSGFGPMGVTPNFCLIKELDYPPPENKPCPKVPWPPIIDDIGRDPLPEMGFDNFVKKYNFNRFTRTDVSTNLGLLTATMPIHTEASMVNSYNGIGALIYLWWGHEARVMFLKGNYDTNDVQEMAKYFGIRYIFLQARNDPLERYPKEIWPQIAMLGTA